MTVTSPVSTPPATTSASSTKQSGAATGGIDYQMFLKMLTTQMKNQDPLNPMDSSNYATQLATFSGVEQQVQTNQLLQTLTGQLGLSGMAQYAPWVGMEARAAAPASYSGTPITVYPIPASGADQTVLTAYDASNHEVFRQTIPVSTDPVTWAGKDSAGNPLPNGNYSFQLESYQAGKMIANDKVQTFSKVIEAQQGSTGALLVLDSGATVAPADITALRPGAAP